MLVLCKSRALDATTALRVKSVVDALYKSTLAVVSPKRKDSEADKKTYVFVTGRMTPVRTALAKHLPADATQPRSTKRKGREAVPPPKRRAGLRSSKDRHEPVAPPCENDACTTSDRRGTTVPDGAAASAESTVTSSGQPV